MAIGHSEGAYANVIPIKENYMKGAMDTLEDNAFKYRAEKRLQAEAKAKARKDSEITDNFDPKIDVTGNTSLDDMAIPFAMSSKTAYSDNIYKYNNTDDPQERQRLLQANNKIVQNFQIAKQLPTIVNEKKAEIIKGVQDDKLNPRDAERSAHILDALSNGKATVKIDDYGQFLMTTYKVDENGNVLKDENGKPISTGEDQNVAELFKSFKVHNKSDYDASLIKSADAFKLDEKSWETTAGNVYTKELKDKRTEAAANDFAKGVLSSPHERYEISQRTGIPEDDITGLEKSVATAWSNRISEKDAQSHNYGANSNAREEDKRVKRTVARVSENLYDSFKKVYVDADSIYKNMVAVTENKVKFKNIGGEFTGLNSGYVTAFSKDVISGNIVVVGKALLEKNIKYKGKDQKLTVVAALAEEGDKDAQFALDQYSIPDKYGDFARQFTNEQDLAPLVLQSGILSIGGLDRELNRLNPDVIKANIKTKSQNDKYSKYNTPK